MPGWSRSYPGSMASPQESALIVPVPDAEPVVGLWRERLDPASLRGVPAHITLLYPFVAPDDVGRELVDELKDLFTSMAPFRFRLEEVHWFGDEVAWIRPEPEEPFVRLTETITHRWPHYLPYEGIHDELVPHLTVAHGPSEEATACAEAVAARLPIVTRAEVVWLMTGSREPASWALHTVFPLGDPSAAGSAD